MPNKCNAYKSLPDVFFLAKSNRLLELHASKSTPSCLKFAEKQNYYYKKQGRMLIQMKNVKTADENKKLNPTIGELLGDNDSFHSQYRYQYSSSKFKRKRHYYRHFSHFYTHGKYRQSKYLDRIKQYQYQFLSSHMNESIPDINRVYVYPTTYTYNLLSAYCYYCYSNMSSCCPYFISNCHRGLHRQEICYEMPTYQCYYQ